MALTVILGIMLYNFNQQFCKRILFLLTRVLRLSTGLNIEKGINSARVAAWFVKDLQFSKSRVNDTPVEAIAGKTWIDKEFAKYSLNGVIKTGKNRITVM